MSVFALAGRPGAALGVALSLIVLAGCTTPGARRVSNAPVANTPSQTTTPADPGEWVGRWQAGDGGYLDIRAVAAPNAYDLVFHRQNRVDVTHRARAAGGRLFYEAGNKNMALNAATGQNSADPSQRGLTYCLVSAPGGTTYCRRRDTADALALRTGAYVAIREDCERADQRNTVLFDGATLRHPGQSACATRTLGQQGMMYSLQADCVGAGQTGAGTANLVIATPDETHIALTPRGGATRLYRYCATGSLPGAIQRDTP